MQVIPAINETDFEEVKKKIKAAQDFGAAWVHLDVSDGKFTKNKLWNNPQELKAISSQALPAGRQVKANVEVHLMVENPDEVLDSWLDAGAKRVIAHIEALPKLSTIKTIVGMVDNCKKAGAELFIAINPESAVETLFEYKERAD